MEPGETVRVGGEVRARVSLRVFGESIEPDEVTKVLGIPPTYSHHRGDFVSGRSGATRKHGMWSLDAGPSASDVSTQLVALFRRLPQSPEPWAALAARGARLDVACVLGLPGESGGFVLSAEALGVLAARGLEASFDLYVSESEVEGAR